MATITHFWTYSQGGVEKKTPIHLLSDDYVLNIQRFLRSLRAYSIKLNRGSSFPEDYERRQKKIIWCEKWIPRFEEEIKRRKLKELFYDDQDFRGRRFRSFLVKQKLKKDEKFIKDKGPSTL